MTEATSAAGLQPKWLIERAKRGDRAAFVELYDIYRTPIFRYLAYQLGGDTEQAQDVCEQVFFEALRRLRTYSAELSYAAWLYRLANERLAARRGLMRPATTWASISTTARGFENVLSEGDRAGYEVVR